MRISSYFGGQKPEPQRQLLPIDERRLSMLTDWLLDRKFAISRWDDKVSPFTAPNDQKDDGLNVVIGFRFRDNARSFFNLELTAFDSAQRTIRFQLPSNYSVGIVKFQDGLESDFRTGTVRDGMINSIEIRGLEVNVLYKFQSPGLTSGQPAFLRPITPPTNAIEEIPPAAFEPLENQDLAGYSMPRHNGHLRRRSS